MSARTRSPAFAPNRLLGITPDFLDLTLRELDARGFEVIGLDAVPERLAEPRLRAALRGPDLRRRLPRQRRARAAGAGPPRRALDPVRHQRLRRPDRPALVDRTGAGDRAARPGADRASGPAASTCRRAARRRRRSPSRRSTATCAAAPRRDLLDRIADLCRQAGFAPGEVASELCLSWAELRDLAGTPPSPSAHTRSAIRCWPSTTRRVAAREIADGRARHRGRTRPAGAAPVLSGRRPDLGGRHGNSPWRGTSDFATAVTTRPGHLFAEHAGHLHALPRVSVNGCHQSRAALAGLLSGVPFLAWNRGRRLNVA